MLRHVEFFPGNFYHIYNRGIDKRIIFNTDHDKERFQDLLYLAMAATALSTGKYKETPWIGSAGNR